MLGRAALFYTPEPVTPAQPRTGARLPLDLMLTAFRKFAKSPLAVVLIGLIIVSFAIFGISDVFRGGSSTAVVTAGSRTVQPIDFKRAFDNARQQAQQQTGQTITPEEAVQRGLHIQLAEEMATQTAFAAWAEKVGINPSAKLVLEQIRQIPAFFDQITGRFDRARYQQQLAQANLTEEAFEREMLDAIRGEHFGAGMAAGVRAPRAYGALQAAFGLETRDASWFVLPASALGAPPQPTDAQLTAFLNENAERLRRPEFRTVTLVRFTPATVAGQITIDEAELRRRYEFRKDTLSTPERRTFVQIPAPNAAAAQRIAEALRAGQDPGAVARANKVDPISYTDRPRTSVSDRRIADAAFSLQPGQVSGPIQGELGLAVVKVNGVTPGTTVTFEQARPQLEADLRREAATERLYDVVNTYEEARTNGANLNEAAQRAGGQVVTLPPFTAQGQLPNGQRLNAPEALFKSAFELPEGGESDVQDTGNGEYFALRVDRITPAAMPSLDQVRAPLTQAWVARETANRLRARGDELAARVRKGEALSAVAASVGAQVQSRQSISRQPNEQTPQEILASLFGAKPGAVFVAPGAQGAVIGKLDRIRPAPTDQAALIAASRRTPLTFEILREFSELARNGAREATKARVNTDLAARALGVTPEEAPVENSEAPAKK